MHKHVTLPAESSQNEFSSGHWFPRAHVGGQSGTSQFSNSRPPVTGHSPLPVHSRDRLLTFIGFKYHFKFIIRGFNEKVPWGRLNYSRSKIIQNLEKVDLRNWLFRAIPRSHVTIFGIFLCRFASIAIRVLESQGQMRSFSRKYILSLLLEWKQTVKCDFFSKTNCHYSLMVVMSAV